MNLIPNEAPRPSVNPELRPWKVGDILVATWGYDQTNANFFRVVRISGDWVTVDPVPSVNAWKQDASMTGVAYADPKGSVSCPSELKRSTRRRLIRGKFGNSIKLMSWGMYARLWDGQSVYISCYG